jgi:hypothetical protein
MRAYVTGSDDAREARLRTRYGLTPRRVAMVPVVSTRTRETARAWTVAPLPLPLGCTILRQAQDRYVATEATDNVA